MCGRFQRCSGKECSSSSFDIFILGNSNVFFFFKVDVLTFRRVDDSHEFLLGDGEEVAIAGDLARVHALQRLVHLGQPNARTVELVVRDVLQLWVGVRVRASFGHD